MCHKINFIELAVKEIFFFFFTSSFIGSLRNRCILFRALIKIRADFSQDRVLSDANFEDFEFNTDFMNLEKYLKLVRYKFIFFYILLSEYTKYDCK